MLINGKDYRAIWREKEKVSMIDQTRLPFGFSVLTAGNYRQTCDAIIRMAVRGAPSIGAAAAYAYVQAAYEFSASSPDVFRSKMKEAAAEIGATRPTAVDLFNALRRMENICAGSKDGPSCVRALENESENIADGIADACKRIGENGARLVPQGARILTHCHAGALATVDFGTALSVVKMAHAQKKGIFVYVDETRPRLQGALTSWELLQEGVPHAVIADNARGLLMHEGKIDLVIVGADRICMNGDFANKIGTYEIAVLAKENRIPFYAAAPLTTFDSQCKDGRGVKIEERSGEEVLKVRGIDIYAKGAKAYNPAFDVTPAKYVSGYITERGVFKKAKDVFKAITYG